MRYARLPVGNIEPLESRRLLSAVRPALRAEGAEMATALGAPELSNTATFAEGNGKSRSGQYPGKAGAGWEAGWKTSSTALSGTDLSGAVKAQSPPIDKTEPNYLQVTGTGTGTISRAYAGADGTTDRVIQFNYRFDETSNGHHSGDYVMMFGANAGHSALDEANLRSRKTNTWAVKAYMNQSKAVWLFGYLNHKGTISFIDSVTSGVVVSRGDIYQFTINEHLLGGAGTYRATVRDTTSGAAFTSPTSLKFCSNETSTDYLNFGMSLAKGETGKFSLDAIHVATKAATAPVVFVIGGLGDPQLPQPGHLSVQQHFEPSFTYAGIDTSSFRWYEENYDTDANVNPNHDTIAAEIARVPAGTRVVLMGLSFGGDQAISSASQTTRVIDDLILFDPVLKTDYYHQVAHTDPNPAKDHPQQITQPLPSNVTYGIDLARVIFATDGSLFPGACAFKIEGRSGSYENLYFPRTTTHQLGQITPRKRTPGTGGSGDPINDTAEFVEDALDGFTPFWDGLGNGSS